MHIPACGIMAISVFSSCRTDFSVGKEYLEQYPPINSELIPSDGIVTKMTCLHVDPRHHLRVRVLICGA